MITNCMQIPDILKDYRNELLKKKSKINKNIIKKKITHDQINEKINEKINEYKKENKNKQIKIYKKENKKEQTHDELNKLYLNNLMTYLIKNKKVTKINLDFKDQLKKMYLDNINVNDNKLFNSYINILNEQINKDYVFSQINIYNNNLVVHEDEKSYIISNIYKTGHLSFIINIKLFKEYHINYSVIKIIYIDENNTANNYWKVLTINESTLYINGTFKFFDPFILVKNNKYIIPNPTNNYNLMVILSMLAHMFTGTKFPDI